MATHASRNTSTGLIFEEDTPINQIFGFLGKEALMFASDNEKAKRTGLKNWRDVVNNLPNVQYEGTGNGKRPNFWSKNYVPDGVIIHNNTLYIIEKKFQKCTGTADAKLSEGGFRLNRFTLLKKYLPYKISNVKYLFILGEWFKKPEYKDRIEYEKGNNPNIEFMFYDENPPYNFFGVD